MALDNLLSHVQHANLLDCLGMFVQVTLTTSEHFVLNVRKNLSFNILITLNEIYFGHILSASS